VIEASTDDHLGRPPTAPAVTAGRSITRDPLGAGLRGAFPGRDGCRRPDDAAVARIAHARAPLRVRAHFIEDGSPSLELHAIEADRLASWCFLQELAGVS
jgi:hypothetical protein